MFEFWFWTLPCLHTDSAWIIHSFGQFGQVRTVSVPAHFLPTYVKFVSVGGRLHCLSSDWSLIQGNKHMLVKNELGLIYPFPVWIVQDCRCHACLGIVCKFSDFFLPFVYSFSCPLLCEKNCMRTPFFSFGSEVCKLRPSWIPFNLKCLQSIFLFLSALFWTGKTFSLPLCLSKVNE